MHKILPFLLSVFLVFFSEHTVAKTKVLISSRPFYALIEGIMRNVAQPTLLLKQSSSIHHYALRPSEIRSLKEADIIIWGGEATEPFLKKPLTHIPSNTTIIDLSQTPGLTLLPLRHSSNCIHEEHHHNSHTQNFDAHFWLDPYNAITIVKSITEALSRQDPQNQQKYHANASRLFKRLRHLHQNIEAELKQVRKIPYLSFHDAFQYFEYRYHLKQENAIYHQTNHTINASHLRDIQNTIKEKKIQCVITDTQFQPKILNKIKESYPIQEEIIDELGLTSPLGEEGYFDMMLNMSKKIKKCLTVTR